MHPARFEVLPFARGEEEAAALPQPVRLTVTCSLKHGLDHSVQYALRLRALGHPITMHVAARLLRDWSHLDAVLRTLAQADIDDIFLIGGDASTPHGPYASAVELLPILHEHPHRPRTIGIAGYPEGHPLIGSATLTESLKAKSRCADYLTTQLCFNAKAVVQWLEALRQTGISLPVFIGLPGVADRRKLLEIAVRVGVGPSLAFLRKQGANLLRLSAHSPESLYEALSPCVGDARLGIAGLHYFTFNRLVETWQWHRVRCRCPANSTPHKEMTHR